MVGAVDLSPVWVEYSDQGNMDPRKNYDENRRHPSGQFGLLGIQERSFFLKKRTQLPHFPSQMGVDYYFLQQK